MSGPACHSLVALSPRFLAELTILWDRPLHPIIRWLWCCLCPGVLLVLLAAAVYFQSQTTWTYLSWNSSSVSVPLHIPDFPGGVGRSFNPPWLKDPIISFSAPRRLSSPLPWYPSHFSLPQLSLFWELRCSEPLSHLSTVKRGASTIPILDASHDDYPVLHCHPPRPHILCVQPHPSHSLQILELE